MLYTSELKNQLEIDCKNCFMVGTLALGLDAYPRIGERNEPITIMKNSMDNTIVFYIKALSDEPNIISDNINKEYMSESVLYIGIDRYLRQDLLPMDYKYSKDSNERIKVIRNIFEGKLILFNPLINFKNGKDEPFKNLNIIEVDPDIKVDINSQFICVPIVNMDNVTFEQKLMLGSNIQLEEYNHYMLQPEYILCGDYIYTDFKSWDKHLENKKMWSCNKEQSKIKRIKFDRFSEKLDGKVIEVSHNLIFIESEYLVDNVQDMIENFGEHIGEEIISEEINDEVKFLRNLKQYTIENNLCYDYKDLINFHVSLKTNPLTIVAGMSGTGKTQLARAYAKVLGLSEEDGTLLFLPISPSYTEPEDLLGYLNVSNGLFMASETGLVDLLIHAEREPKKMHMVIFDEMNLSQVEYWFAPFMSLLELEEESRFLKLYGKNSICYNGEKYKSMLQVRDNIIFIGTVNLDETTKDFSDRLLDRANMVTLKKKTFASLKEEQENEKDKKYISTLYDFPTYSGWVNKEVKISQIYNDEELILFDKLHEIIQKYDNQKGVSFRIFGKIGHYLNNIPIDVSGEFTLNNREAIDIQIKQRLLTKIKGSEKQLEGLIGKVNLNDEIPQNGELYDFLISDEAQKVSDFQLTIKEICRKARELYLYGYTN